tara:strand:+ start:431 stop:874 length:444 start_codon:yes stop_codon:yes gene_type:complete
MKLLLTFILLTGVCFGQSKKVQIADLNKRLDSLNTVLSTTRDNVAKEATELNTTIEALNKEITVLKGNVTELENTNAKVTEENEKMKTDLGELTQQNLALEAKLKAIEVEEQKMKSVECLCLAEVMNIMKNNQDWDEGMGSYGVMAA